MLTTSFRFSKNLRSCAVLGILGMGLATAGHADTTYTWNFATSTHQGDVGAASAVYLDNSGHGISLPVHGYTTTNAPSGTTVNVSTWTTGGTADSNLYNKFTTSLTDPETGLGLTFDGDHEIVPKSFIQIDTTNLKVAKLINPTIMISSIQQNEGYYLWGSNSAGTPGILLNTYINTTGAPGADVHTIPVPGYTTYNFFAVSSTTGNTLIGNSFTATTTPEPGVVALLLGLAGPAGLLIRRRKRK